DDAKSLFDPVTEFDKEGVPRITLNDEVITQSIYVPIEFTSNSIVDIKSFSEKDHQNTVLLCPAPRHPEGGPGHRQVQLQHQRQHLHDCRERADRPRYPQARHPGAARAAALALRPPPR
nr:hypothetical protein [Tanacetum cinerariifolium]